MDSVGGPPGLVAIVAGSGSLPKDLAEARREADLPYLLIVFPDCFEDWMSAHPHEHHQFEKAGALFQSLRQAKAEYIAFAGGMNRPKPRPWRADLKAAGLLAKAVRLLGKGDDAMLRGFAGIFEAEGLTMLSPVDILGGEMLVPRGLAAGPKLSDRDRADAARAARIVQALGPLDVGQGAVVSHGVCLAVEAVEGTDLMLEKVTSLPEERRAYAPPPSGVLFKGPKPGQDQRIDLPTIGPRTMQGLKAAGLNGVVVAAGQTVLMDRKATLAASDDLGVFIYGAAPEELAAWSE